MRTIGEALREIMDRLVPLGTLRLPLLDALGSVLAEDFVAREDSPPFDNSAMDGYALRGADVSRAGARLALHGESRAGGAVPGPLPTGSAMRIFTGAPIPEGADAVVIQEDTRRDGDAVVIAERPRPGAHIRRRGADLARGQLALPRGSVLGAGELGLLAAQGVHAVSVFRSPRVAILATGDELRDIGDPPRPGSVVNSNVYALAALIAQAGAEPWVLPTARDALDDIAARIREGLRADVLLTVGGVSVGEHDRVGEGLRAAGVELHFWKVAIKPGKPLLFGTARGVPVFGLPGNPVSAMVTFEVFVRPALRRMQGHGAPYPFPLEVELEHDHHHSTGRTELVRATLQPGEGRPRARAHPLQGSGSLPSMCAVDALLVLDAETAHFARGSVLPALALRALPGAREPWIA